MARSATLGGAGGGAHARWGRVLGGRGTAADRPLGEGQPGYRLRPEIGVDAVHHPALIVQELRGGSFRDSAAVVGPHARAVQGSSWNERDPQIPQSRWWLSDAPFVGFRIVREP